MWKECNVVMLATNEKAKVGQICVNDIQAFVWTKEHEKQDVINALIEYKSTKPQHLYIFLDEKIGKGDWFLSDERDRKDQNNGKPIWKIEQCEKVVNDWIFAKGRPHEGLNPDWCKKIISTTNKSIQALKFRNSKLEAFSKILNGVKSQIPQSFIEHYITEYNKGNIINKVIVEYNDEPTTDGDWKNIHL